MLWVFGFNQRKERKIVKFQSYNTNPPTPGFVLEFSPISPDHKNEVGISGSYDSLPSIEGLVSTYIIEEIIFLVNTKIFSQIPC